jgi:glycosyltransferase involved in cell wall biosynthesis
LEYAFAPIETFFEEAFRRFADGSIVLTSALKKRAISLGVKPETILQTNTGADVERIHPGDKTAARKRLKLDPDKKYIGYVGVTSRPDRELMAESFELMNKMDPSIKLVLIGRKSPKDLKVSPSAQRNIITVGGVSFTDLHEYIAACDLMLLPLKDNISSRGRWPMKIGDYLAGGRPVVVTRVGDFAMLIEEGQCGILTRDDPEDFATQTVHALQDKDWIEKMGQNARMIAETRLDWRLLANQVGEFYQSVLEGFDG